MFLWKRNKKYQSNVGSIFYPSLWLFIFISLFFYIYLFFVVYPRDKCMVRDMTLKVTSKDIWQRYHCPHLYVFNIQVYHMHFGWIIKYKYIRHFHDFFLVYRQYLTFKQTISGKYSFVHLNWYKKKSIMKHLFIYKNSSQKYHKVLWENFKSRHRTLVRKILPRVRSIFSNIQVYEWYYPSCACAVSESFVDVFLLSTFYQNENVDC